MVRVTVDKDPRCRLISRPQTGIVRTLNDGLAAAKPTD